MKIKQEIMMTLKKSTKGTHVYEADSEGTCVPTLYIRKDGFEGDGEAPQHIIVEIQNHD